MGILLTYYVHLLFYYLETKVAGPVSLRFELWTHAGASPQRQIMLPKINFKSLSATYFLHSPSICTFTMLWYYQSIIRA